MSELDLRLHCLALAVKHLSQQPGAANAYATAQEFFNFLAPATAGCGVPYGAQIIHPAHLTIQ